ncbi:hypothetical protein [Flavobacterium frigoris]|uniref:Outer membrane protein beta-barrel domain-containing protein n=1 Tax=Flavobacterium frigoris (strain PS1) TaxID=1086011 RepID=H7FRG1_FLAFP|nr:hypothetical protein [Flavobacterium frigoris]EIA08944.1 hypothetical protein HJ01_01710 [Flavobacterium frigoris PS1]
MKVTGKIKMLFVFAVSIMFANNAQAQDTAVKNYDQGFKLGFGVSGGYATQDPYKLALGADARLQYDLTKRYSLTLTTGFTNLFVSEADGSDLGFIPAKAGFKAFVWNDEFYVMGEAGAAFAVTNGYDQTSLILAPSVGYATKYIDVSLRYEHYSDFPTVNNNGSTGKGVGQVGVRLAYGFEL